jgi:hypothetical protein
MDSEPQSGDLQPSCSTGRCGRRPWMVWLGLVAVVVVYAWLDHRSNTVVPLLSLGERISKRGLRKRSARIVTCWSSSTRHGVRLVAFLIARCSLAKTLRNPWPTGFR